MFPKKEKKINSLLFFLFLSFLLHSLALLYPYNPKDGRREEKSPILVEILDFPQQQEKEKPKEVTRLSQKSHSTEKETKKKVISSGNRERPLAKHEPLVIARLPKETSMPPRGTKGDESRPYDGRDENPPKSSPFPNGLDKSPFKEGGLYNPPIPPFNKGGIKGGLKPRENMAKSQQNLSRPQAEKENILRKRPLTLKELLPSYSQLAKLEKFQFQINPEDVKEEDTVSLNTTEFKYISYFSTIKRQIELVWQYPLDAVIRQHRGKLFLKFTILKDGNLQGISLIRSSGHEILDDEAIRAVKVASPFNPIPKQLGTKKLNIVASFEYILTNHLLR